MLCCYFKSYDCTYWLLPIALFHRKLCTACRVHVHFFFKKVRFWKLESGPRKMPGHRDIGFKNQDPICKYITQISTCNQIKLSVKQICLPMFCSNPAGSSHGLVSTFCRVELNGLRLQIILLEMNAVRLELTKIIQHKVKKCNFSRLTSTFLESIRC